MIWDCLYSLNVSTGFWEGNSASQAIELLIQKGVPESHIIFLNLISVSVKSRNYFSLYLPVTNSQSRYAGSRRNPLRLQTVSIVEDCDIGNRSVYKRRVSGYTRLGWVWWSLLWYWRLKVLCLISVWKKVPAQWVVVSLCVCGHDDVATMLSKLEHHGKGFNVCFYSLFCT